MKPADIRPGDACVVSTGTWIVLNVNCEASDSRGPRRVAVTFIQPAAPELAAGGHNLTYVTVYGPNEDIESGSPGWLLVPR